jgi:hypothetical protein
MRIQLNLELGVTDGDGNTGVKQIEMTQKRQRFEVDAVGEPRTAALDPNVWALIKGAVNQEW